MATASLTLAVLLVRGAVDNPVALRVPPDHLARAAALVEQLGSRQFADRDSASRDLERMGRLALPAVRRGCEAADAEVRARCDRLRPPMEAEELAARLGVFVADAGGRYDHAVPGWDLFRWAAGDDRAARDLFAAVSSDRANWPLLTALRGPAGDHRPGLLAAGGGSGAVVDRPPPGRAAQAAAVRRWEFFAAREAPQEADIAGNDLPLPKRPEVAVPDMALVMLAECLYSVQRDNRAGRYQVDVNSFLNRKAGRDALEGKGRWGPAFARVGRVWLDTRDGDAVLFSYALAKNIRLDPAAVGGFADRVFVRRSLPAEVRAECLGVLVRQRPAGLLDRVLAELAAPESADGGLRDFLLGAAVLLTGQELGDYGMAPGGPSGLFVLPPDTPDRDAGAVLAARRAAGYARWRGWEATHFGAVAGPAVLVGRKLD